MCTTNRTILTLLLLSLCAIEGVVFFSARASLRQGTLMHLSSLASVQRNRIAALNLQNRERLAGITSRTQLRLSLKAFLAGRDEESREMIDQILRQALGASQDFEAITVLGPDGAVVTSAGPDPAGRNRADPALFAQGRREPVVDDFFLDLEGLKVHLAGPLTLDGELLGVAVIRTRTRTLTDALADPTGLGETGELVLARREADGSALFIAATRFDPAAALNRRVPAANRGDPVQLACAGVEDVHTGVADYRGRTVLAATRTIPGTGWGLVAKIDAAEAFSPVYTLAGKLGLIALITLVAVAVAAQAMTRRVEAGDRQPARKEGP